MLRVTPTIVPSYTTITLGPLVAQLPSRLHMVGKVREGEADGGAYKWWSVTVHDDEEADVDFRISWATDNKYVEDFENVPRVTWYIKDVRGFAANFLSDLELFRSFLNTIPKDLEGQTLTAQTRTKGMLMMKTVGPLRPVEVDGSHVTLIRPVDNNDKYHRVLAGIIFDDTGHLQGTLIVSPEPLTITSEATRVFDDVFSGAEFAKPNGTTPLKN